MPNEDRVTWKSGGTYATAGAAVSLASAAVFALFRRRLLFRLSASFAAAFVEKWRENRLGAEVRGLLAKAGRDV